MEPWAMRKSLGTAFKLATRSSGKAVEEKLFGSGQRRCRARRGRRCDLSAGERDTRRDL
jgi:hypothetical protein